MEGDTLQHERGQHDRTVTNLNFRCLMEFLTKSATDVKHSTKAATAIHGIAPQRMTTVRESTFSLTLAITTASVMNAIAANFTFATASVYVICPRTGFAMYRERMAQKKEKAAPMGWKMKAFVSDGFKKEPDVGGESRTMNGNGTAYPIWGP